MVAYFRKQNNLFMLLGAVLGLAAGLLFLGDLMARISGYFRLFFLMLPVIVGGVLGRILSGLWANKKLQSYNDLLYNQAEPERFLEVFTPLVDKAPRNTIAYVDGCNKLAYACEALGRFDEAMDRVASLKPEELKNHALGGMAITCNQQLRLLLLQEKTDEARDMLQQLRNIAEAALERAPTLGKNTQECVRLYENWLLVLEGQPTDEAYLTEEIQLAKNRIHKSEIQIVLARALANREDREGSDELLLETLTTGKGLWAEGRARELLGVTS